MVPVRDLENFIMSALESRPDGKTKAKIGIKQIFLKTWNKPEYSACQVEMSVDINGAIYIGTGVVKIDRPGQSLLGRNLAQLDPDALDTLRLALKSAYLNALNQKS